MNSDLFYLAISIGIILATIVIGIILNRFFKKLIRRSTEALNNDPTNYQFLRRIVIAVIYLIGFGLSIYVVPSLRVLANSILAGAGILAVAIGFASQHALSNIISGFFIILFKPFRIGDYLSISTYKGVVEDITLRHVVICDMQNHRIIIPNSVISNESITNSNIVEDRVCRWIEIGISYDSDVEKAKQIIHEEILAHPLHIDPRSEEEIANGDDLAPVRIVSLGESSVVLRGWAWSANFRHGFIMYCDLLESIKKRFASDGIVIPFPQRDIHLKRS